MKSTHLCFLTVGVLALMPTILAVVPEEEPPVPFDPVRECGSPDTGEYFAQCLAGKVALGPIILPAPPGPNVPPAPTPDEDELALYRDFWNSTNTAMKFLEQTPPNEIITELKMFIRAVQSVVAAVKTEIDTAFQLDDCGRLLRTPVATPGVCAKLLGGTLDDAGVATAFSAATDVAPVGDLNAFKDFIGSPYLPLPLFGLPNGRIPHEVVVDSPIKNGGSHVITKEMFGLKLRLWYTWVPIWIEPWYSRRRIIGYKRRWFLRWVPCEYIKSIIHRTNQAGVIQTPQVYAREYCDSRLLGYWRWFGQA